MSYSLPIETNETTDVVLAVLRDACAKGVITVAVLDCLAKTIVANARALWAVRVLDACADAFEWPPLAPVKQLDGSFAIALIREVNGLAEPFEATGSTEDAARHAAALAVFPTLDAATRERLGGEP